MLLLFNAIHRLLLKYLDVCKVIQKIVINNKFFLNRFYLCLVARLLARWASSVVNVFVHGHAQFDVVDDALGVVFWVIADGASRWIAQCAAVRRGMSASEQAVLVG